VIYKETPTAAGEGFEAYTMPKPCWAIVRLLMEPGERGSGLAFRSIVGPNQMLPRYQNHVEKCLPDALKQGLYGWEVTDLKVTLIDGEHHIFHTHPLDFFVATPMAVMNGLVNTGTTLLEPMLDFRISAPEDAGGRIMGDLVHMRSEFDSPVISKGSFTVTGKVPVSTSMDFPVRLSSVTSGHGVLTTRFSGYQPCAIELGAASP
jgi:ribosomal protection tetracycline resistance protein